MAIITTDNQHYTDIANAIRSAAGSSDQYKPEEMATAISEIVDMFLTTSILSVTAPAGSTVTCAKGEVIKNATEKNGKWWFWGLENGEWTVNATLNGMEDSAVVSIESPGVYEANLYYIKIYGISRNTASSSPDWTRTDDAVGLTATASEGTISGASDFDSRYPWSGIQRETLSTGDVMVKIPKFYFRRYLDGSVEHIEIANMPTDGFKLHPAFNHSGIETDCVYVGAYKSGYTSGENSVSLPGKKLTVSGNFYPSISTIRSAAKAKGNGWGLIDISTISAIQMLFLVEFATNDSQLAVGSGCTGTGAAKNTGTCDNVPNLTGRPAGTDTMVDVVWRGIEGIWGNMEEYVDGIIFDSGSYYICNDPDKYGNSVTSDYTELSYTGPVRNVSGNVIKTMGLDNNGNEHIMLPASASTTSSTDEYYCDCFSSANKTNIAYARGGSVSSSSGYEYEPGIFEGRASTGTTSTTVNHVISRLLYIPA